MQWIAREADLNAFLDPIKPPDRVGLDTEFLRTNTYYPRLCLIQLAREDGEIALIDPLNCTLEPLWRCLTTPGITTVVHAAWQDLEVLYQASGCLPATVFDTQIAALLHRLGDKTGLAQLVQHFCGITLPKDATRTDWCRRPLNAKQCEYAANDVRYLLPLHTRLTTPLSEAAQAALSEDFDDLLKPSAYAGNPEQAWQRISGGRHFSAKQHTLLRRLAAWREKMAQQHNLPRRWVIGDDALLALAKRPPASLDKLKNVPGLSKKQVHDWGAAIIDEIDRTFAEGVWEKGTTRSAKPTAQESVLQLIGRAIIEQQALSFGFSANALQTQLLPFLRHQPTALDRGWRRLLVGDPLRKLLAGTPLTLENDTLIIPHEPIFKA